MTIADESVAIRFGGTLASLSAAERRSLLDRRANGASEVELATAAIIADVRDRGDAALRKLAALYDGVALESLEVPRAFCRNALDALDPDLRRAMERSAENITRVHSSFMPRSVEANPEPGIVIGRRADPLSSVGVYAPGGRAAYPSSVLMGAVPARVAGVREVILCSPPERSGYPSAVVLAAAELASVDRVFAVGGAGAIAAMAFGTATVPKVEKIVGPGNAYVAEAKRQLTGGVSIDSPAGPSELLVIADATCRPDVIATEMLAQAEHDPSACVVAVCIGENTARSIEAALARLVGPMARADICMSALASQSGVLVVDDIDEAIAFAASYAPEHLLLVVADAEIVVGRIRNAGTIFVGESSSVAFGDYLTGANHVLPTGGAAHVYSGLGVDDFLRWTTWQTIDSSAASRLARDTAVFARAEGLPGHAAAALQWSDAR